MIRTFIGAPNAVEMTLIQQKLQNFPGCMKRRTVLLLSLIPVTTGLLWLDALEPGQGVFYNPLFWAKARLSALVQEEMVVEGFSLTDPRLNPCQKLASENQLSETQEQMRSVLTGESKAFALQQLGPPTCVLGGNAYRWLTESGLAVDITMTEEGVEDVELSR